MATIKLYDSNMGALLFFSRRISIKIKMNHATSTKAFKIARVIIGLLVFGCQSSEFIYTIVVVVTRMSFYFNP